MKCRVLNSRGCCPGLSTGKAGPDKAGRTLVVVAFTRHLRLADEERTAHLSSSVSLASVLMLDQTFDWKDSNACLRPAQNKYSCHMRGIRSKE